jgi:hypothetical protein
MEVHHHPQLPHTGKVGAKHYLLEYLMIFLAVATGFFAENIREHLSDKKKEKEYMASLVEDMKSDLHKFSYYIPILRQGYVGLDTLVEKCYLDKQNMQTRKMYYAYHHYCRIWYDLKIYDKTLIQLKNSGNLRLFSSEVEDTLASLDEEIENFNLNHFSRFLEAQNTAAEYGFNIFDYSVYTKANVDKTGNLDITDQGFLSISYDPPLLTWDKTYLKQFASRVGHLRNQMLHMMELMQSEELAIEAKMKFLENFYGLKDQ